MENTIIKQHYLAQEYLICQATSEHFEAMLNIFLETAEWLRSKGIRQWGHFVDGYGRDDITASIDSGSAYVVLQGDTVIGTVCVLIEPEEWDHHIWPDTNLEDSVMIHRLAVSRDFAGMGIGKHIITWVENGLQFPSAKKYIRLDCVGDNEKLNAYYVSQGFEKVGSTDGHSNYQKEIGAVFS